MTSTRFEKVKVSILHLKKQGMDREITIEKLFTLQDGCLKKNRETIKDKCTFVEECIKLICNRNIAKNGFAVDEINKFKIVHQFLDTALSSLINSYRLLLYGCSGDALSLLRVVFEAIVFQEFTIEFNAYEEVKKGIIFTAKGKNKLKFNQVLKKLENNTKTDRGRLFGFLTDLGSHITPLRMKYNYFKLSGKTFPITGHAILERKVLEKVIFIQMRLAIYMLNVLAEFYRNTKPDAILGNFFAQRISLSQRYKSFKD